MATSPTSKSATTSGAAKDDAVGLNGDYTFTIQDLLGNDPGGAAKQGIDKQFFFGSTAADQSNQAQYLLDHGITKISDANGGTYQIGVGATAFDYFVQIGNKGTWSQAHVDVTAPPAPAPEPHAGACLFTENFDSYANLPNDIWSAAAVNLATGGWQNAGFNTEVAVNGYGGVVNSTSGNNWLDTQATVDGGPIDIMHQFYDPTGGQVQISFDIATERFSADYFTAANASFDVKVDGNIVQHITAQQIRDAVGDNHMMHFDVLANTGAIGGHTLELVDSSPDANDVGFALDTIHVSDWGTDVAGGSCENAPHLSGNELLANWNFEQDNANIPGVGFVQVDGVSGWTNEADGTSPMEVQHQSFGFITGFAQDEFQWLDTSASPGNIHIGQDTLTDIATGAHANLSISVAAESIDFFNGASTDTYQPDADDHLLFVFNDTVVKDITLSDFTDSNGNVNWNDFQDFNVDVVGGAGTDHFEIQSTGMNQYTDGSGVIHGYAGFAVDHVSLQEWVI